MSGARPGRLARLLRLVRLVGREVTGFRPSWSWALAVARSFLTSFLALTASLWLLPGTQVTRGATSVATVAVLVLALGALVRPLLTRLTVLTGVVGLLLAGLLAQSLVLALALSLVPTVEPFSAAEVLVASWSGAVAAAGVNWLFDASSDEAFLGQLLRRAVRRTRDAGAEGPGLLVVQLDGVAEPVLRQALTAGALPTVSRWLRSGSHRLRGWHTGLPATTPAGQAVLMHGDTRHVPGFRWWDKDLGRMVAAGRPGDAALVEEALSDGRGLLAGGGASVSNVFSGDAAVRVLTVSRARVPGGDPGAATYMTARWGFLRSVTLLVGQMITEWHQARRQRVRGVLPRVHRGGRFAFLRGLTTVVLRDLNVTVVADQLTRGTPVVYVDFVDYDEVAHHAGPTRPEALRTLENLDRVLHLLDRLVEQVGRRYEVVVLSDHGQAQGTTFLQLTGRTLEQVVRELASGHACPPVAADEIGHDEVGIPARVLVEGARGPQRLLARAASRVVDRPVPGPTAPAPDEPALAVACSGGLAHVYRTDLPGRLTRTELDERHPGLVRGLAEQPGVGAVVTRRDACLLVDGPSGQVALTHTGVEHRWGEDPLATYGSLAAADLLELEAKQHVGDLVVLGAHDPVLGEVAAFEELVGSHGGLGGAQTEAFLLHPAAWSVPAGLAGGRLTGRQVHDSLVARLRELGLRTS